MARLCPLFSGSSGNSYYIGTAGSGLLLDAGRSARQLTDRLRSADIDPLTVQAVLVTHEHIDHVRGLRVFAARYGVPVYATAGTAVALRQQGVDDGSFECRVHGMQPFACGGFAVTPFPTSHDSAESCGYRITCPDGRVLTLATDLGFLSEAAKEGLRGCDFAVIESNHDVEMLKNGPYPYPLKKRILSKEGHLSNDDCAAFLPQLAQSGTGRFLLAHLSRENNTPQLAFRCAEAGLAAAGLRRGTDYWLGVAPVENTDGQAVLF